MKTGSLNAVLAEFALALLWAGSAFADLPVRQVEIGSPAPKSRVPEITARGRFLALPWRPDVVFTGHGVRTNGLEFLTTLVRATEASLASPPP